MKHSTLLILSAMAALAFYSCIEKTVPDSDSTDAGEQTPEEKPDEEDKPDIPPVVKKYSNPIHSAADPWIWHDEETGLYYLCHTASGNIYITVSDKLSAVGDKDHLVWSKPKASDPGKPWNSSNIWAPEIHKIDGLWYIYYTAGRPKSEYGDKYYSQRCGVLRSKTADPLGEWEEMPMLYTGDEWKAGIVPSIENSEYAIDFTVFRLGSQMFGAWSGGENGTDIPQSLYLAKMSDPCTVSSSRVKISFAEAPWECAASSRIQEGPAVLQHGGKTFITYSTNGSWTKYYRLGLLTLLPGTNPMKPSSWEKSSQAAFYRCDDSSDSDGVNGVGHNCFTTSPDGTEDWIVYHVKHRNDNTWDSGRSTFIQKFTWKEDGTPDFGTPLGWGEEAVAPSGE